MIEPALGAGTFLQAAQAQTSSSLTKAIALFGKGDYQGCADALQSACAGELANNATAHYYLANSLLHLGKHKDAAHQYQLAKTLSTDSKLNSYCDMALANLSGAAPASRARMSGTAAAAQPSRTGGGASGRESTAEANTNFDLSKIDKSFLQVHRQTPETNAVLGQAANAMTAVPDTIVQELKTFGVKVLVTPTIVECCPDMVQSTPRGYAHGGSATNIPAMYKPSTKTIYIAEKYSWLSSVPYPNRHVRAAMLHEMGHAFDNCRNYPSEKGAFSEAYQKDMGRITNTQRTRHQYYTQEGDAGPSELFAELFSYAIDPGIVKDDEARDLISTFPQSYAAIKSLIQR